MKMDFRKAATSAVLSLTLVAGTAVPAFALDHDGDSNIPDEALSITNSSGVEYTTGAATRAAMPSIEILGLASVEESGQFVDTTNYYNWEQPKYMLAATNYNTNPSPYLANLATGEGTTSTTAAFLSARTGGGAGPNASLGTGDTGVWSLSPDIVVGTGGGSSHYANYGAVGVSYGFSNYSGLVTTMKNIATAADAETTALRYSESATTIANEYEQYIFGTMGYIAKQIADPTKTTVTKRNVVLVTNVSYDDTTGEYTYTLMTTAGSGGDGTASTNRYLETTSGTGVTAFQDLAGNYADTLATSSTATTATITSSQLTDAVEDGAISLIMVGGQQASSNYSSIMEALIADQVIENTYFVKNNGSSGAMYGVVMNSVENAQNVSRILGMLYSDVISQQDWLAYYFEQFYHIDSTKLSTVMENALDGVRNANVATINYNQSGSKIISDATEWDGSGGYTSDTDASDVQAIINEGYAWYTAQTTSATS